MIIKRARPAPASQAEKVIKIIGVDEKLMLSDLRNHKDKARNKDSMTPSMQSKTERKCFR